MHYLPLTARLLVVMLAIEATKGSICLDTLENCYSHPDNVCRPPHNEWAKEYCPLRCNLCDREGAGGSDGQGHDECPNGWQGFQSACFKIFDGLLKWEAARNKCEQEGAVLPTSKSKDVNDFLRNMTKRMSSTQTDNDIWLNARDEDEEGVWRWLDDDSLVNQGYTNWQMAANGGQEPTNFHIKNCLILEYNKGGEWRDVSCNMKAGTVCKIQRQPPWIVASFNKALTIQDKLQEKLEQQSQTINGLNTEVAKLENVKLSLTKMLESQKKCTSPHVGFMAGIVHRGWKRIIQNHNLVMDKVITNEGNDYSGITGKFTCRVPGLYRFELNLLAHEGHNALVQIVVSTRGRADIVATAYAEQDDWNTASTSVVVQLERGAEVRLKCIGDSYISNHYGNPASGENTNIFSGNLIQAAACLDE